MGLPLITKEDYKAYSGIKSTNSDNELDILIPRVSALVKTICRRTFVDYVDEDTPKIEKFSGGYAEISVAEYPMISYTVEYSEDYGATYEELVEGTDFYYDHEGEVFVCIGKDEFPKTPNGYKITYNAGYTTLPEDLTLAVMDLVTYYLKNDMAIKSTKAPGTNSVQIEYVSTTNLPAHIKRVLDLYMANYA